MFFRKKTKTKGREGEVLPDKNEGPPDSHLPSGLCPRCGKQSSFEIAGSLPVTYDYESHYLDHEGRTDHDTLSQVSSLICRNCRQGVVVVEDQWIGEQPRRKGLKSGGEVYYKGVHWYPLPEMTPSTDIPSDSASAFAEAAAALAANCPRASAVMARRTLEAITVEKGEIEGSLAKRLRILDEKGVLHPSLAEWVKEVRLVGNVGAHFDPIQPVSMDDAKQLVNFLSELLKYLYELPAELKRRRSDNSPGSR